ATSAAKPVLVAAQPYGAGRVVLVAPSDTWRLAVGAPDVDTATSARFWTGLVAWASAGATTPVSARFDAPRVSTRAPIRAELVVRSGAFEPVRAARIAARCERTAS